MIKRLLWFTALGANLVSLQAQWLEESITLEPGWNAVFLSVEPTANSPEDVFADLPVQSVWMWNEQAPPAEFIQDPARLTPDQPEWLVYLPDDQPAPNPHPLYRILGGRAYLIQLRGEEPVTWEITGIPIHRTPEWRAERFHLTGFPVHPAGGPTFASYFASSTAHSDQPIYQLNTDGHWVPVQDQANTTIQPRRAYWVFSRQASNYEGPIRIQWERRGLLSFGNVAVTQNLGFQNVSESPKSLILQLISSAPAGDNGAPVAGPVALTHFISNLSNQTEGYFEFPGGIKLDLGAGQSDSIRFAVRREQMTTGNPAALFQSLLIVEDGRGLRLHIPISSQGRYQPSGLQPASNHEEAHPNAGLWVGDVTVDGVNEPRNSFSPNAPQPTRTGFQFRVILHVDRVGNTRLLRDAIIMATAPVADELQRFVILTDESLLNSRREDGTPRFIGSTLRDGTPVGRRISSVNFSMENPIPLTGTPPEQLSGEVLIPFDHPLNPFVHRYHPDHDNKNREFEPITRAGLESFDIQRRLTFEFTEEEPTGVVIAGYGSRLLGGTYRETITGLHKDPLQVSGTFRLARLVNVPELNDGLSPQLAPAQSSNQ